MLKGIRMKKDLRKEIIKKLEGIKRFSLSWNETTDCYIEIEAKDKNEARDKFFNQDFDWNRVDRDSTGYDSESLDINEIDED